MKGLQFLGNRVENAANAFIYIHKESRDNYISGNSYTWCPCCGKCYILSEEEVVNAIDNDLSVYAECSCGNSFYIETEDEQDNYSEW